MTPGQGSPPRRSRVAGVLSRRSRPETADQWGRPPERPTRYRLLARLSDTAHGWLDGRRGLPYLPRTAVELPRTAVEPGDGIPVAAADSASGTIPAPVAGSASAARLSWLMSPRMLVLSASALEQIRAEEMAYWQDCAAWKKELQDFRAAQDEAAERLATAKDRLGLAQRPLSDQERKARRLAEQDQAERPENFVAERRQNEWERRLRAAEREYLAAAARHAEAARQAQLREELIRDRLAVARAAAQRHYEFAMRRIATYQQQLVRRHRRGADLNLLLMSHPAGPDLPAWTTDLNATPAGGERWTGEPYLGEEASNP